MVYYMAIWSILQLFSIFLAIWYITYMVFWYIFSPYGMMYQEKSGNPGLLQDNDFARGRVSNVRQGGQIGRIFSQCVIFYCRNFFGSNRNSSFLWTTLFRC
jgi:magnesium-transporting ATPase (P-type)